MPEKNERIKKSLFVITAHPDDEAFGPSGTIAKFSKDYDIYVLCATRGEVGLGKHPDLGKVRENELRESAKILGVKEVFFLGFIDGTLSNSLYHKLASKIEIFAKIYKPEIFLTFEPRGVSGHIDHITVSMVTTYVFYRLKFVKKLLYYCIRAKDSELFKDYFIYFPPGYPDDQIGKVVDVADVWDIKIKAMFAHKSQLKDVKRILRIRKNFPKREYFQLITK